MWVAGAHGPVARRLHAVGCPHQTGAPPCHTSSTTSPPSWPIAGAKPTRRAGTSPARGSAGPGAVPCAAPACDSAWHEPNPVTPSGAGGGHCLRPWSPSVEDVPGQGGDDPGVTDGGGAADHRRSSADVGTWSRDLGIRRPWLHGSSGPVCDQATTTRSHRHVAPGVLRERRDVRPPARGRTGPPPCRRPPAAPVGSPPIAAGSSPPPPHRLIRRPLPVEGSSSRSPIPSQVCVIP
jgi:hypothetical protein